MEWLDPAGYCHGGAELCSIDNDTTIITSDDPTAIIAPWFPAHTCVDFQIRRANTETSITADNTLEGYFVVIGERQANPSVWYLR